MHEPGSTDSEMHLREIRREKGEERERERDVGGPVLWLSS